MTERPDEERVRRLLDDAVSRLEPADGLAQIRSRTRGQEAAMSSSHSPSPPPAGSRSWMWGAVGAAAAVAAIIGSVALLGDDDPANEPAGAPSAGASPVTSAEPSTEPSTQPSEPTAEPTVSATEAPAGTAAAGVYYLGKAPNGLALFREFRQVPDADRVAAAVNLALSGGAQDPDYRTGWPAGTTATVTTEESGADGLITVDLAGADLAARPGGTSAREAELAVEQVVYTAQAAVGARAPVQLLVNGDRSTTVLGVNTAEPLAQGDPLTTLSSMSISDPGEGATASGKLSATGVSSCFEATVVWELRQGETTVKKGFTTAEGWMDKLYPWTAVVPLAGVAPGSYTFVAMCDDPTGGTEGFGPATDTRTITVQ